MPTADITTDPQAVAWDALIARMSTYAPRPDAKPAKPVSAKTPTQVREWLADRGYVASVCPSAYSQAVAWLVGRFAGTERRGLVLYGPSGTGKTMLARLIGDRLLSAARIVEMYREHDYGEVFSELVYGIRVDGKLREGPTRLAIDDLGQEPQAVSYGQRDEVLGRVLCERYEHWQRTGVRTVVTTNCTPKEVEVRYGRRVLDRLTEMCVAIEFAGKSARAKKEETK